jgi:DNA-directed RNA polymerase specialized sigma24 family protein
VCAAPRFDPRRRFSTWLFQIAVNLCRDWHRRRPPEPVDTAGLEDTGSDGTARVEAALDARRCWRPAEAQRSAVLLRTTTTSARRRRPISSAAREAR